MCEQVKISWSHDRTNICRQNSCADVISKGLYFLNDPFIEMVIGFLDDVSHPVYDVERMFLSLNSCFHPPVRSVKSIELVPVCGDKDQFYYRGPTDLTFT
jgi:hypothetical protein